MIVSGFKGKPKGKPPIRLSFLFSLGGSPNKDTPTCTFLHPVKVAKLDELRCIPAMIA